MKKLTALILSLVMVLGLAACGQSNTASTGTDASSSAEAGVLRVAALYDITTMDVAQTTDNYMVPMNVFDRLFDIQVQSDGSTKIVPSLCTEYKVSDDGLTYDFTLRDGVVFSNGSALTASDVQYSFARLLTAGGVNDDIPLEVKGGQALKDGTAKTLEGFKVTDDTHFSITLEKANAGFVAELTSPAVSIVDEDTMKTAAGFGQKCEDTIGTGPYKVTEWVPNDHYTLEANDKYWGDQPSVKKVIVSIIPDASTQNLMYQNGELDIIDLESLDASIVQSTYKTTYKDKLVSGARVGMTYLAMNENNEYLKNVKVRQAVQKAIDIDTIIKSVYSGDAIPEAGIIPTGVWGHNDSLQRVGYDVEGAKALLKEAGYADGEVKFELAMDTSASSSTQLVYQIIQQELAAVGITATIKNYDESSWLDLRKSGEMDAFVANWTMDYNDPANIMYTFFGSAEKTKLRSINYADAAVMARVAAASGITDDAKRLAEYQSLEKTIVMDDAAWVPLLENTHLFALGDRVQSFTPYWAGYSNFYAKDVVLK
jgi:peptide/nickel transport system substrate-binding protein